MSPDFMPDEVVVARDRQSLAMTWPDGRDAALSAFALRHACRCAWCTRDRILDRFVVPAGDVELRQVEAVGSHGLHIKFSDGHERGIYPWIYLDELAHGATSKPGADVAHRAGKQDRHR